MVKKKFLFNTEFDNQNELFEGVSKLLVEENYVSDNFVTALKLREASFATGLPTIPAVAIPHTDGTYVKKDAIVCIKNCKDIRFNEMGGDENDYVYPKVFFILVMSNGKKHLEQLQRLIEKIQDGILAEKILESKSIIEFEENVNNAL